LTLALRFVKAETLASVGAADHGLIFTGPDIDNSRFFQETLERKK
jgi:hypothetical protein